MENNNPPFADGQKIVRTGPTWKNIIKGNVYTVHSSTKCNCGLWTVWLEELPVQHDPNTICISCGFRNQNKPPFVGGNPPQFAPHNSYSDSVSKELAQEALKDRIETDVKVKELQN